MWRIKLYSLHAILSTPFLNFFFSCRKKIDFFGNKQISFFSCRKKIEIQIVIVIPLDKNLRMNGSMELPSTTVVANNKKGKGETSTNITIGTNTECHVDSSENMCPICYESDATCMTACGHKYCNDCLGRLSKCALCRTPFQTDKPRKRRQRRREANEFLVEVERQRLRAVSVYLVEVERQRLREAFSTTA